MSQAGNLLLRSLEWTNQSLNSELCLTAQQPRANVLGHVLNRAFEGAFPDYGHTPTPVSEQANMFPVSDDVVGELLHPKITVRFRDSGEATTLMSVPEAAVDE